MKQDLPFAHLGILLLLFLIAINLLILDLKIFYDGRFFLSQNSVSTKLVKPPVEETKFTDYPLSCPVGCIDIITQATASARLGSQENPVAPQAVLKSQKEYIIPLGAGSTSKSDWENLISTETIINPSVYGTIKEAYLIISLKNPTKNGQIEARLFNVTDNNVVYGTHVVMNDQTEQTITTQKFALPPASKFYRMQLKSSLGFAASLENSRLKIIAE